VVGRRYGHEIRLIGIVDRYFARQYSSCHLAMFGRISSSPSQGQRSAP
jgi:hypothetical protein